MTRPKAKRGRPLPPKRRIPVLTLVAVGALILLFGYSLPQASKEDEVGATVDERLSARVVSIGYRADPREWRGRPSTLCEVVDHYALGAAARAATLHLNAQGSDCAAADRRIAPDERVPIAVWAPPDFPLCRREAASCD